MKNLSLSQPRIDKLPSGYNIALDNNPMLYHCSPTSKEGIIDLTTKMTQCRETFLSYIRRHQLIDGNKPKGYFTSKPVTSSFRFVFGNSCSRNVNNGDVLKINELVALHKKFDERTEQAVAVVNMIEDYVGWPNTTVYKVNVGHKLDYFMYMFEASKRWNRGPQLASLLLYILRSARMVEMEPYGNIKEAVTQLGGVARQYYEDWIVLLEKFDNIFKGFSHSKMYSEKIITESTRENNIDWMKQYGKNISKSQLHGRICDQLYPEGIQTLCSGSTRYDIILQRLITYKRIKDNADKTKRKKKKNNSSMCNVSYAT